MERESARLVREGLQLAEGVARRMHLKLRGFLSADELLDSAHGALLKAVNEYDPVQSPFPPYIIQRLKWAMLDEVRRQHRRGRLPARAAAVAALERVTEHAANETALGAGLPDEGDPRVEMGQYLAQRAAAMATGLLSVPVGERDPWSGSGPEEDVARKQLRRDLLRAVEALPEKGRILVLRHYFMDEPFEAIARELGISKSWASRVHAQAMDSLAKSLRSRLEEHAVAV